MCIVIYTCSRGTCQGISKFAGGLRNASCWHQLAFPEFHNESGYIDGCDSNDVLCVDGSWGHLCGSCKPGYIFSSQKQKCEECNLAKSNVCDTPHSLYLTHWTHFTLSTLAHSHSISVCLSNTQSITSLSYLTHLYHKPRPYLSLFIKTTHFFFPKHILTIPPLMQYR